MDDVTHLSLDREAEAPNTAAEGTIECKFWGLGGDGTVGANKNSIKIIGDHTDKYIQAYFQYDSKKTGGVTVCHLRFGDKPIKSPYYINKADFVACHNPSYIVKNFPMVQDVKPGGIFLINCQWDFEELEQAPPRRRRSATSPRTTCSFTPSTPLTSPSRSAWASAPTPSCRPRSSLWRTCMPKDEAVKLHEGCRQALLHEEGRWTLSRRTGTPSTPAPTRFVKIDVPADWANAAEDKLTLSMLEGPEKTVADGPATSWSPWARMNGDSLPVSAFVDYADGTFQQGAAAYEKRGVAVTVPEWTAETCAQCNQCAYVCPHATIRPYALNAEEAAPRLPKAPRWSITRCPRASTSTPWPSARSTAWAAPCA